jgi:hypothetical protein
VGFIAAECSYAREKYPKHSVKRRWEVCLLKSVFGDDARTEENPDPPLVKVQL